MRSKAQYIYSSDNFRSLRNTCTCTYIGKIREGPGENWEVRGGGVGGVGTSNKGVWYKSKGVWIQPDPTFILNVCPASS